MSTVEDVNRHIMETVDILSSPNFDIIQVTAMRQVLKNQLLIMDAITEGQTPNDKLTQL